MSVKKGKLHMIAKKAAVAMYNSIFNLTKTSDNLIVFDCSDSTNYTGSPKAIYEYMVRIGLDMKYDIVWLFRAGKRPDYIPGRHRVVTVGGPEYMYVMSTAKVWVFDARNPQFLRKRDDQYYIQTWHGTPLKKLALDLDNPIAVPSGKDLETYKKDFYENTRIWDYLVAQNDFSANIFRSCFAFDKEMLMTGYPRNDILFERNNPDAILHIKEKLHIPTDKKILLYAPTYRDDEYDSKGNQTFTPKLDFKKLREAVGEDTVVLVKYHYFIANHIDWSGYEGFVYPFEGNADINELYLIADRMITDYSSVMFDYSLLHRPMYYYCYDLDAYRDAMRGFYFDFLEEAPGPISLTTEDLIRDLQMPEEEFKKQYGEKEKAFYKKFHGYDDGHASEKIVNLIKELMNK